MSAISGISTGDTSPRFKTETQDASMGKDDFLKLLVAQLQNQDPMNPADPTEFTSQLAQFSQLEQLSNINSSLDGLDTMSSEMERMSALGLMGQEVVAQTEQFHFNGEPMQFGYRLDTPADDVKMYVLNQSGSTLTTISAKETDPGQYFVDWDGYSDSGMPLPPGDYSLVVRAVDQDEKLLQADSLIRGRVAAVDMSDGSTQLETSAGIFPMSKVERVGAAL
ncbi:MAG: flagellar hook assembly protein FlgD [Deltaproteobacteria bacterium]|nr:flagellar hook assembly protein FlgD [Deltaproteobacteria bacterium]